MVQAKLPKLDLFGGVTFQLLNLLLILFLYSAMVLLLDSKLKCLCSFTIELKYGIFKSYFIQIEEIEPKMITSSF